MSEENEIVVSDRDFWIMGAAFLMLALAVGVMIVNLIVLSGDAAKAAQTYSAACAFRQNLEDQVKSSEKYLAQHPAGAPALGLTAAQIQNTIDKQQAAANSLSGLNCSN